MFLFFAMLFFVWDDFPPKRGNQYYPFSLFFFYFMLATTQKFHPKNYYLFPGHSGLHYKQLCVILEPMQELMSRHKAYALSPRDCLKTTLFQKWQRMVAPPGKRGTFYVSCQKKKEKKRYKKRKNP